MKGAGREDFTAELETHLELMTEDNVRRGLSPAEARREAILRLGGTQSIAESWHDQRVLPLLDTVPRDLRFAVRRLIREPGFAVRLRPDTRPRHRRQHRHFQRGERRADPTASIPMPRTAWFRYGKPILRPSAGATGRPIPTSKTGRGSRARSTDSRSTAMHDSG